MPYTPVTPTQFKAAKPQFAAVNDPIVQSYLDMAGRFVDRSWTEGDYQTAIIAMTCHLMTLDGLGTDPDSQSQATGSAQFQTIRSGELTLTRFRAAAGETTSYLGWLAQTACGRFYAVLLKMNRGGPRVLHGGGRGRASGYAKDWPGPSYGWPGVFL